MLANDGVEDIEISCGDGLDNAEIDLLDRSLPNRSAEGFPLDCEADGSLAPKGQSHFVELSNKSARADDGGDVKTRVSCPKKRKGGCEGELTLETVAEKPRVLGESRYDLKAGEKTDLRVKLSTKGSDLLKRRGKLLAKAIARRRNSRGQPLTAFTRRSTC